MGSMKMAGDKVPGYTFATDKIYAIAKYMVNRFITLLNWSGFFSKYNVINSQNYYSDLLISYFYIYMYNKTMSLDL